MNLTFFDLVTLDDPDLTQGHKRLRRILRSIQDTIHVATSALFQSNVAALPGEASNDRYSKIWPLARPVTSSVTFRQNFAIYSESCGACASWWCMFMHMHHTKYKPARIVVHQRGFVESAALRSLGCIYNRNTFKN